MMKKIKPLVKITPTLLNAWVYLFIGSSLVRESENDEVCKEDKEEAKFQVLLEDFRKILAREEREVNTEAIEKGIQFEKDVMNGLVEDFSNLTANGVWQVKASKEIELENEDFNVELVGICDCLNNGIIYDIKSTSNYEYGKFIPYWQQECYLYLFEDAKSFSYLIDYKGLHFIENYFRETNKNLIEGIYNFINFLRQHNLLDVYINNWRIVK